MNDAPDKVFAQAEALWRPEAVTLRKAFDTRRAQIDANAAKNGAFQSGSRIMAQADAVAEDIRARSAKLLEALLEAHKLVHNIRGRRYSVGTFCTWFDARLDEERAEIRRNPTLVSGSAETVDYYVDAVTGTIQLEKTRAAARIRQHFAVESEWWLWYYFKKLGTLKAIPAWIWLAAAGWALLVLAIFNPELAAKLHALLPHTSSS